MPLSYVAQLKVHSLLGKRHIDKTEWESLISLHNGRFISHFNPLASFA